MPPTVLIIDADDDMRFLLQSIATTDGWDVRTAADLWAAGADAATADVVMHRFALDERLDRRLRELRLAAPQASVVAIGDSTADRERALAAGADLFVPLPFEVADLLDVLRTATVLDLREDEPALPWFASAVS